MDEILHQILKLPELERELRAMKTRIPILEQEIVAIKAARKVVKDALADAARSVEDTPQEALGMRANRRFPFPARTMALEVMREAIGPMTTVDMAKRINEKYGTDISRGSLDSRLSLMRREGVVGREVEGGWFLTEQQTA